MSAPAEKNRGSALETTTARMASSARTASTAASSSCANSRLYAFAGARWSEIWPTAPSRSRLIISPTPHPHLRARTGALPGPASRRATSPAGRAPSARGKLLAQPEALNLSSRRLRELGHELDPARIFVRGDLIAHERLQLLGRGVAAGPAARLEHDERIRLHQAVFIGLAHDTALQDGRVLDQRRFDLRRGHPLSPHLQHVVGPPAVPVKIVPVPIILVARDEPVAAECLPAAPVPIPVARGDAVAVDEQVAEIGRAHV